MIPSPTAVLVNVDIEPSVPSHRPDERPVSETLNLQLFPIGEIFINVV